MKSSLLLFTSYICLVCCIPPPHPDVVAVRHEEELLHPLQRSPALRNPHLLKILPLTSLLHRGESVVFDREASKVPRKEIYKILTHAGLISRNAFSSSWQPLRLYQNEIAAFFPEEQIEFHDSSHLSGQDHLQYL